MGFVTFLQFIRGLCSLPISLKRLSMILLVRVILFLLENQQVFMTLINFHTNNAYTLTFIYYMIFSFLRRFRNKSVHMIYS